MSNRYDALLLENQLCFPLYACSREIIKVYKPFLDELNLTYTQYIAMMVLWEKHSVTAKEMGNLLYLDSGTLTPLLKKLEAKNYLTRQRSADDERNLVVTLSPEGEALKEQALQIPQKMTQCLKLNPEDTQQLYRILRQLLEQSSTH